MDEYADQILEQSSLYTLALCWEVYVVEGCFYVVWSLPRRLHSFERCEDVTILTWRFGISCAIKLGW